MSSNVKPPTSGEISPQQAEANAWAKMNEQRLKEWREKRANEEEEGPVKVIGARAIRPGDGEPIKKHRPKGFTR